MGVDARQYRTICYVDGFNLYYGLKESGWKDCYWLNIRAMASHLVRPPYKLSGTKYFTARVDGAHPSDSPTKAQEREASRKRQALFLEALETLDAFEICEGRYLLKRDYCRSCNASFHRAEEKMTDVRIATEMMTDAFLNRFDAAVVVSADSDLSPPITAIRLHFPDKRILVAYPPKRFSQQLKNVATSTVKLWKRTFERSQFPAEVLKQDGTILRRPVEWQ